MQRVAAESEDVAFVVLLAGPAQSVRDQIPTYERIQLERTGAAPATVRWRLRSLQAQLTVLRALGPARHALRIHDVCPMLRHDPLPHLERIAVPVTSALGLENHPPEDPSGYVPGFLDTIAEWIERVVGAPHSLRPH